MSRSAHSRLRSEIDTRVMALDMLEMAAGNTELDRLRGIAARLTARVVELRERLGATCLDRDFRFVRVNDALAEMNRLPVDAHRPIYVV